MSFCHNKGSLGVLTSTLRVVSSRFNLITIRKIIVTTLDWRKRSRSGVCISSKWIHKWLLDASNGWGWMWYSETTIVVVNIGVTACTIAVVLDWADICCVHLTNGCYAPRLFAFWILRPEERLGWRVINVARVQLGCDWVRYGETTIVNSNVGVTPGTLYLITFLVTTSIVSFRRLNLAIRLL